MSDPIEFDFGEWPDGLEPDPELVARMEQAAVDRAREAEEREAQHAAMLEEIAADHERADKAHQEFLKNQSKELDKARTIVEYETALKEAGLKHMRMPNEGDEDYSELPKSIHVTGDTYVPDEDLAPEDQHTEAPKYDFVPPPPLPQYPNSASEPEPIR